ncbi:MAG: hypothetical protein KAG28_09715 [Cocleimonas sp.]|nr:hypothetical protein [Cocleimonas sp.]
MRIRIKTKWSQQEREVSVEETVSILAFNCWKIGMQTLLEIENENFQIDTHGQRIEIMEEIVAFLIHALDRMVHDTINDEDRATLIQLYAQKMADHVQDNARDVHGAGDYRSPFYEKLNQRFVGYADTKWDSDKHQAGFSMGREFGTNIAEVLGTRDKKWALDYLQQVLLPEFFTLYRKTVKSVGLIEDKTGEADHLDGRHHMITDKEEQLKQKESPKDKYKRANEKKD